jgi:heptosyltransferase-1
MRVLVIKTSSLGDVIHTLPAITEASEQLAAVRFDWVVEERFAEVPDWHPAVGRVIPVALRRWRHHPLEAARSGEWRALRETIKQVDYDLVIDAQGLLKSAFLVRMVGLQAAGYDRHSIREPAASFFYQQRYRVSRQLHAVERIRQLFAAALDYPLLSVPPGYGTNPQPGQPERGPNYLVWLHGSTWMSKMWPESFWIALSRLAVDAGYEVLLPWGNPAERQAASRIATHVDGVTLLPAMTLAEMAAVLGGAVGVVGVDSGPAHLAAAMATPAVCLYGATSPVLTGTWGGCSTNLQAQYECVPCLKKQCGRLRANQVVQPCVETLPAERVFARLMVQIDAVKTSQDQPGKL